jgi:ketosteroid isomerase-like protein
VECNEAFDDEDVDDVLDCYHDDFTGWLYGDNVPRTKAASEIFIPTYFDLEEPLAYELRPISIWVEGDFAFAHYFLRLTYRDANGQVVDERQNWTDILLREDGDWFWVGDHGGVVTNRP